MAVTTVAPYKLNVYAVIATFNRWIVTMHFISGSTLCVAVHALVVAKDVEGLKTISQHDQKNAFYNPKLALIHIVFME